MIIVVIGKENSINELSQNSSGIDWRNITDINDISAYPTANAIFNLSTDAIYEDYSRIKIPVFVNSVTITLKDANAAPCVCRINGWNGFLKRSSWEVAGDISTSHEAILFSLQKKIIMVRDEPGFISARIICMIINEAFFARQEYISTESEIDIAMKLGTNYPFGPFEWASAIGEKNVCELLTSLCKTDARYQPSLLLQQVAAKP